MCSFLCLAILAHRLTQAPDPEHSPEFSQRCLRPRLACKSARGFGGIATCPPEIANAEVLEKAAPPSQHVLPLLSSAAMGAAGPFEETSFIMPASI